MATFERKKVMPEERRIMLGDTPPITLEDQGYISWFRFGGTLIDQVNDVRPSWQNCSYGNDGRYGKCLTYSNGSTINYRAGLPFQKFTFNPPFSVDFWARTDNCGDEKDLFQIIYDHGITIELNYSGSVPRFIIYYTGYESLLEGVSQWEICDGNWHHIAFQVGVSETNKTGRSFLDGNENTNDSVGYFDQTIEQAIIGMELNVGDYINIDEFRIMKGYNFIDTFDPNEIVYPE